MIKDLLTEKNIDFSNLSEKSIKKLKSEWDLKKEMAELGIDTSKNDEDEDQYEDGVTLSSRRPRRNVNKVSYKPQKPKFEEEDSQNEDANDDDENYVEEEEENDESSDQDVYEPPSEEDEDDDYEM